MSEPTLIFESDLTIERIIGHIRAKDYISIYCREQRNYMSGVIKYLAIDENVGSVTIQMVDMDGNEYDMEVNVDE